MLKTAGLTFASKLVNAILSFALIVFISQVLGAEGRGICAFYQLVITFIIVISEMAGGGASSFLLSRFAPRRLFTLQCYWAILPSLVVPAIFAMFTNISWTEYVLLFAAGWLQSNWNMQQHLLLGMQFFARFNFMHIVIPCLSIAIFGALFQTGLVAPLYYLVSLTVALLVGGVIGIFFLSRVFKGYNEDVSPGFLKSVLAAGISNQLSHIASLAQSRMVYFMLPATSLGLWANTLTLSEAIFLVPGSLGQVMYGLLAKDQKEGNIVFRKAWWTNISVTAITLLVLFFIPDRFWVILFGKEFLGMRTLIISILPGIFLYSLYLVISYRQSASGYFNNNLIAVVAGFLVNAGVTAYFVFQGNYELSRGILALIAGWAVTFLVSFLLARASIQGIKDSFWPPPVSGK